MQLADVITSFRHHWRAALGAVVLIAVGLGLYFVVRDQTRPAERWEASIRLLIPVRDEDGTAPPGVPPRLLENQGSTAESENLMVAALEAIGLGEDDLDDFSFQAGTNERGDILTLTVGAPTEEQASDLAEGYSTAYTLTRQRIVAQSLRSSSAAAARNVTTLQRRLAEVETELQQIDPELLANLPGEAEPLAEDNGTSRSNEAETSLQLPATTSADSALLAYERHDLLRKIESARRTYGRTSTDSLVAPSYTEIVDRTTPQDATPEAATPLIPLGLALALAVAAAIGLPVLLDRIDHSIRDSRTAGSALAAPVLSTIPAPPAARLEVLSTPESRDGHAYRTLATASIATDQLPRALVVTAPKGHMQDIVAANFAAALADLGLRVVLVPTDPRQAWYAEAQEGVLTLPDFLHLAYTGRLNGEVPEQLQRTTIDNLRVVAHAAAGADALIDGLPPLLRAFADTGVDVTVIAAPSILDDPAATILAWSTRSVLWVVETGEVTQQQAQEAAAKLELAGASPFGVAVVERKG